MLHLLTMIDTRTYLKLNGFQKQHGLTSFFRAVSHSGDGHLYVLIAALIYSFQPPHHAEFIAAGILAYLLEVPVFVVLKSYIKRDRPFVQIENCLHSIQPSDKFSMPSGHTAAAFVMAGLLSNFYPALTVVVYSWASLIGLSRVALGVHYPGDILAGALLGASAAVFSLQII